MKLQLQTKYTCTLLAAICCLLLLACGFLARVNLRLKQDLINTQIERDKYVFAIYDYTTDEELKTLIEPVAIRGKHFTRREEALLNAVKKNLARRLERESAEKPES